MNTQKSILATLRDNFQQATIALCAVVGLCGLFSGQVLHAEAQRQGVLIATVQFDSADKFLSIGKVETALTIALELTGRYSVVSSEKRDSLIAERTDSRITVTDAASELGAELIAFCSVGRIANLIRTEIVLIGGDGWIIKVEGVGYALSFHRTETGEPALDPALLTSLQRALCVAVRDSSAYAGADSVLQARPTTLASVGGIVFEHTDNSLPVWSIFKEKITASYDIASIIVAELRLNKDVTVIDLDTRDTIFSASGLYMLENYNPTSSMELETLRNLEITHLITGTVSRVKSGATLTLAYNEISASLTYKANRSVSENIKEDSKPALRDALRKCIYRLFAGSTLPEESK